MADELRDRGVIVALVSPPPTGTDMLRQLIGPENAARQGSPTEVIGMLITVFDGLTLENSGGQPVYFDGTLLPWQSARALLPHSPWLRAIARGRSRFAT